MTKSMKTTPIVLLAAVALLPSRVLAQVQSTPSNYPCGDPNEADGIFETSDISSATISLVRVGAMCPVHNCHDFLLPEKLHWHVIALPPGSNPKHTITPPGFVRPVRNGNTLSYEYQNVLEGQYSKGDDVEAGVQIYVPIDQLTSIQVSGVEEYVQVTVDPELLATDKEGQFNFSSLSLQVRDDGVDNAVTVTSPSMMIDYAATGVDSILVMEAATRSSLRLSGVDNEAYVKSDQLDVYTDGVDGKIVVEGNVANAVLKGVDGDIEINGSGCDNGAFGGVDNGCKYTDEIITVIPLSCTVQTELDYMDSWFRNVSTGAKVGMSIAFILIFFGVTSVIIACCSRKRCNERTTTGNNIEGKQAKAFDKGPLPPSSDAATHNTVVEAEVLEVKNDQSPANMQDIDLDVEDARFARKDGPYWKKYSN
mmetsp:Transcript_61339/g.150138  ORF Transcript_61339/g.150138 Transcript_61339/m.150138 type:complete len:423 (-) Transcript_61339:1604-2872(-)